MVFVRKNRKKRVNILIKRCQGLFGARDGPEKLLKTWRMGGLKIRNCGNYPEDPYRCVSGRCSYLCIDKPNKRKDDGKDHETIGAGRRTAFAACPVVGVRACRQPSGAARRIGRTGGAGKRRWRSRCAAARRRAADADSLLLALGQYAARGPGDCGSDGRRGAGGGAGRALRGGLRRDAGTGTTGAGGDRPGQLSAGVDRRGAVRRL